MFLFAKTSRLAPFLGEQDGAVTVDWVVLTAAVVGIGAVVGAAVFASSEGVTTRTSDFLAEQDISSSF